MYVRWIKGQRFAQGTIQFIPGRGVRQIYMSQGLIEELPNHNPNAPAKPKEGQPDAHADTKTDDASASVDGGDTEGSKAPAKTPTRRKRVRQRASKVDTDRAGDD